MSYFGAFNRMFVHFHFYITYETACESLHDLDLYGHSIQYHLFQYIDIFYCLI